MKTSKIILLILFIILIISCKKNDNLEGFTNIDKVENANENLETNMTKIKVGYMADFSGTSTAIIAQEKGYFINEHLDVELVKFLNGPSEVDAMLADDIQFAYIGHGAHSLAIQGKVNVLFPNGLSKSEQIIARKDAKINSIADLNGKKIGTQIGTSSEILLDLALQTSGVQRKNVKVLDMDGQRMVLSIFDKTIDAVSIQAPYTFEIMQKLSNDVKVITTITNFYNVGSFPSSWIVTPDYQRKNPDIVEKFSKAILKAMDYRAANLEEAIEMVANFNKKSIEDVALEKETGIWFSGEDVRNAYIGGEVNKWYESQQNIFIFTKVLSTNIDINKYVQIRFMNNNVLNEQ